MHCWSGNVDIEYWKSQYQTGKNSGQNSGRSITKQRGRLPDTARAQVVPSSQLNFFVSLLEFVTDEGGGVKNPTNLADINCE